MEQQTNLMKTIANLRYKAARYQLMGDGPKCQHIALKIRRLLDENSEQ